MRALPLLLALLPALPLRAVDLTLAIEPRWRGAAVAVPMPAVEAQGQALRITRLSGLLSDVALWRADGGRVRLAGQYGFVDAASGRLDATFRGAPAGDYTGLEFSIGLPPEINHAPITQWPAGHPLNPLVNSLFWGWQGGYVFLALEGRWRGAGAAEERGFSYHLATDGRRMMVRFAANYSVSGPTRIALALELSRVVGREPLVANAANESTHSGADDALATQMTTAVEHAWFWLGASVVATATPAPPNASASRAGAGARGTPLAFTVPAGFPQPELPADNPLTAEGVALGQKLFRDPRLSGTGRQSCASCHDEQRAFSDRVALSRGADGEPGRRNAMPLYNLAWSGAYAWDGSQPRIRDQARAAMTKPVEMHGDPIRVAERLGRDEALAVEFAAVFGSPEITADRIGRALEQYLLVQVSADSRFDRAVRGEAPLTEEEKRGFALFLTEYDPARGRRGADCFHCHGGPLFTDFAYKNNGLRLAAADRGRREVTGREDDAGKFKTPSLRNIAVTGPYMHDGRFTTLEQVVAHYDHGVTRSATLDPNIAKHPAKGLELSAADQQALVAFLRTLTDPRFEAKR